MKKLNTILYIPPFIKPTGPLLGTPTLLGFLRNKGIDINQKDLNLLFWEYILDYYTDKNNILEGCNFIEYIKSINFIRQSLKEFSKNSQYNFYLDNFISKKNVKSIKNLVGVVNEDKSFTNFYNEEVKNIIEKDYSIIGISISYEVQLIPALVLAKTIKSFTNSTVILGGSYITNMPNEALVNILNEVDWVDIVINYNGENALYEIIKKIEVEDYEFKNIDNIIWKSNSMKVVENINNINKSNNMLEIIPEFEGLNINRYLSPSIYSPVLLTQGCYYRKCTFCSHYFSYGENINIKSIEILAKELDKLRDKNIKYIHFVDDAIPIGYLKEVISLLKKYKFEWLVETRLVNEFLDERFIDDLKLSGCKLIMFGIESFNKKSISLINKGIDVKHLSKVSRLLNDREILVGATFIVGFPWETKEDMDITLEGIISQQNLNLFGISKFSLMKNSVIEKYPEEFKILEKWEEYEFSPILKHTSMVNCDDSINSSIHNFANNVVIKINRQIIKNFMHRAHYLMYEAKYFDFQYHKKLNRLSKKS